MQIPEPSCARCRKESPRVRTTASAENSTTRASWVSFLTSKASTSFHNRSRYNHCSGAFSGKSFSEWTTPRLGEKP